MIVPPTNVRAPVATKPVDFRKGATGLAAIVAAEFKADPFSGVIWVFRSKRADRVKLLFWDSAGLCPLIKRLEEGQFRWPRIEDGVIRSANVYRERRLVWPRSARPRGKRSLVTGAVIRSSRRS